ncbi:MAG: site-specific DNA-methyltransferase [Pseudomonadota bacterium]
MIAKLAGVDAVITDPPYGVKLGENSASQKSSYASFDDTPENVRTICVPIINSCRDRFARVVLTPGVKNMFLYDKPNHVGSFYYPSGAGCNSWGFSCWQPIFYYGKDPFGGKGSRPDSKESCEPSEKNGHPCPKPIGQTKWLVNRASLPNETVFDPFMGSGTTGVACVTMDRNFVGCEVEPAYFDIACRRIEQAQRQGDLFIEAAA